MTKSILDQLATSLGHRDEKPNIDLAVKIARSGNQDQVAELISLLAGKKADVRNDAVKVLYEIGERNPDLISGHVKVFLQALHHKDNRMKWGAMHALSAISKSSPSLLAPFIVDIVKAIDEGSVITRDHGIYILAEIAKLKKYHKDCMELLLEQIEHSPVNQMPMYAEKTAEVISAPYIKRFLNIITKRTDVMQIPSKAKRIEKLVKSIKASLKE
jgi:hypothetical protein